MKRCSIFDLPTVLKNLDIDPYDFDYNTIFYMLQNHSSVTILISFVFAFNRNQHAKLCLPSTFQASDIELRSPKNET